MNIGLNEEKNFFLKQKTHMKEKFTGVLPLNYTNQLKVSTMQFFWFLQAINPNYMILKNLAVWLESIMMIYLKYFQLTPQRERNVLNYSELHTLMPDTIKTTPFQKNNWIILSNASKNSKKQPKKFVWKK